MDQSKRQLTDLDLRITALSWATQWHVGPNGYPEDAMKDARMVYLFITGKDPVIDGQCDLVEEFPEPDQEKIISLFQKKPGDREYDEI